MKKMLFCTKLTKDNKLLRDYLIRELNKYCNPAESTLLDIGCGNGRFANLLHNYVKEYYGIDPDKDYIKLAKGNLNEIQNVKFKLGRAEEIPFKKKFNIILFSFSWHYIADYKEAIKELNRISDKESIIIILEPSLTPRGYRDKRLNKSSPEFSKELWNKKLNKLKEAKSFLKKQESFKILSYEEGKVNLWVLKNDKK